MSRESRRTIASRDALLPPTARADAARRERGAEARVLFALPGSDLPSASLETALALSDLLQAELHTLRVLPVFDGIHPLAPSVDQIVRATERRLDVEHTTRVWFEGAFGSRLPPERLKLRYGDPVNQITAHAGALEASMIVVSPGVARIRRMVTALASASRLPVLVARARGDAETIVAATDLRDRTLPVLRTAAELGRRLNASLVAIHNVDTPRSHDPSALRTSQVCSAYERRLRHATRRLDIATEVVVSRELSSADAILREARMRKVDLIVVGARARRWPGRWLSRDVAARVASGAQGSVLVTPLELMR